MPGFLGGSAWGGDTKGAQGPISFLEGVRGGDLAGLYKQRDRKGIGGFTGLKCHNRGNFTKKIWRVKLIPD